VDKTLDLCQDSRVGLFDLDDYQTKKTRADESATPSREFPVALAEVFFDGRKQTLRFQPVLFDGGHVFIGFRPENLGEEHELIAGGGGAPFDLFRQRGEERTFPQALLILTEEAFQPQSWLERAIQAVDKGLFGRLIVEETGFKFLSILFHFHNSAGAVMTEHYQNITDGNMGYFSALQQTDFDPRPRTYWAKFEEAGEILISLNADEFARYLELQKAEPFSVYGLSCRWAEMTFAQKHALLPPVEQEIERELLPLMQAIVWSDASFSNGAPLQSAKELQKPFWRRPRLWVAPDSAEVGDVLALDERFKRRIHALWPHLHTYFAPLVAGKTDIHPAISHWMRYRGAYIVEWQQPNAHEHLEARLLLRDFLANRGVLLDVLERGL